MRVLGSTRWSLESKKLVGIKSGWYVADQDGRLEDSPGEIEKVRELCRSSQFAFEKVGDRAEEARGPSELSLDRFLIWQRFRA